MPTSSDKIVAYIDVSDRDYHGAYVDSIKMLFDNINDAKQWCKDNSTGGIDYDLDVKLTKKLNNL